MLRYFIRVFAAVILIFAALLLVACGSSSAALPTAAPVSTATQEVAAPSTTQPATPGATAAPVADPSLEALTSFLSAMHEGRYRDAANAYAGDYSILQSYNPDLAADDHAGLLKRACETNGFLCLEPAEIKADAGHADTMTYNVTFRNPDGSILGFQTPGDPGDVRSTFKLQVQMTIDGPRAITLPPFAS